MAQVIVDRHGGTAGKSLVNHTSLKHPDGNQADKFLAAPSVCP